MNITPNNLKFCGLNDTTAEVIMQYSSLEQGVAYVERKLASGQWSIHQSESGNWWLCTNPNVEHDVSSVYDTSRKRAIELHVRDRAAYIGFDWVFG